MLRQYFNYNEILESFLQGFCNILCYVGYEHIKKNENYNFLRGTWIFFSNLTALGPVYNVFYYHCVSILQLFSEKSLKNLTFT